MDQKINTMTIENTETVSETHSTENVTDSSPPDVDTINSPPDVDTITSPPDVDAITSSPDVDAITSPPDVDAITSSPDVDNITSPSDIQEDNAIKNKKQKITNVKGKDKRDAQMTKSKNLKRKAESHPPTSEMVMASIKSLRKYKGASLEDISKYMEENYSINSKRLKVHINKFLEKSVGSDILEKVSGSADGERFKIKKSEKAKKDKQSLLRKDGKKKLEKTMTKQKRQVKK